MRRFVRILLALFLILGGVSYVGIEYLNRVILPVKVKPWAESTLSQALGRKVAIAQIKIHPWHGIFIQDVVVEEDARYGKEPFLRIDRISGGILYLPLLKERRLVIPILRIVRPRCRVLQDANGIWNIQSLKFAAAKNPASQNHFQVLIPKVILTDGDLELQVLRSNDLLKLHLQPFEAHVGLSLPASIQCHIRTQLATAPSTALQLEGSLDTRSRRFHVKGKSLVPLATLSSYFPAGKNPLPFSLEGLADCELEASGNPQGPFALQASLQTKGLRWKTNLPKNPAPLQGVGEIQMHLKGSLPAWEPTAIVNSMSGTLDVSPMNIGPLPVIGELRGVAGHFTLGPKGIQTDRLTALLASGQQIIFSGALANDDRKAFTLKANADLSLEDLPLPMIEMRILAEVIKPRGRAMIEAQAEGFLKPTFSWQPAVTAALQGVSLNLPEGWGFREGTGSIRLQQDLLTVTGLQGKLKDQPFSLEGSLINFSRPEIDAHLAWGDLAVETQLTVDGNRAEIHTLSGRYQKISFRLFGEVTDWKKKPTGNLYGETTFTCQDLKALVPNPQLKDLPLEGEVQARCQLQGPLDEPRAWDLDLKANSPQLIYQKIPFTQVALECSKKGDEATLEGFKANFSGGTIAAEGRALVNDPKLPWQGSLDLQNVELSMLAKQMDWKTKDLAGSLFLDARVEADGANLASLRGNGRIRVEGGRILELPLLGGLAEMLRIPSLKTMVFEKAEGPFTLSDGQVKTETFQLKSPQATLSIAGAGGFLQGLDSPIDWHILPTLSPDLIPKEGRSKLGQVIAQGTSYLVGEIKVTGTWKNPKQTFVPKPIGQILNEQLLNLKDTLKDIF